MAWYFDLISVYDKKHHYLQLPRAWLLDYTPHIISQISNASFFDLEHAYLIYDLDGMLFKDDITMDPYVEIDRRDDFFIDNFTDHCLEHKMPFNFTGFMAYDWCLFEEYKFRWYKWVIKPNTMPEPNGFKFNY